MLRLRSNSKKMKLYKRSDTINLCSYDDDDDDDCLFVFQMLLTVY